MSPRSEPVQERAHQTRAAVVRGAAAVFERRGYAGASLDLIAEEAGVTRGAMYFHFRSKDEIANAVITEQHRIARVDAETAMAKASSAVEAMLLMSAGLARQLVSDGVVSAGIRLTTDGSASSLSNVAPYRDWMATFENLAGLAVEQGDFRPDLDAARFARFLIPAYTGVQLVSDTLHDRQELFERVREMWDILLPGVVVTERIDACRALLAIIRP
jgi:AcrR family transcriptional regulator